jgi:hypothetical protein
VSLNRPIFPLNFPIPAWEHIILKNRERKVFFSFLFPTPKFFLYLLHSLPLFRFSPGSCSSFSSLLPPFFVFVFHFTSLLVILQFLPSQTHFKHAQPLSSTFLFSFFLVGFTVLTLKKESSSLRSGVRFLQSSSSFIYSCTISSLTSSCCSFLLLVILFCRKCYSPSLFFFSLSISCSSRSQQVNKVRKSCGEGFGSKAKEMDSGWLLLEVSCSP